MNPAEKSILSALDGLAEEMLAFTGLIAEPSTLGNEKRTPAAMESELGY